MVQIAMLTSLDVHAYYYYAGPQCEIQVPEQLNCWITLSTFNTENSLSFTPSPEYSLISVIDAKYYLSYNCNWKRGRDILLLSFLVVRICDWT